MASITIIVGDAVLNTAAFIGSNYIARALRGGDKDALEEKVRHDKALEEYQTAYAKYTCDHTKLLDWIVTNAQIKVEAKQNFTNTDYAFKLYNKEHTERVFIRMYGSIQHSCSNSGTLWAFFSFMPCYR